MAKPWFLVSKVHIFPPQPRPMGCRLFTDFSVNGKKGISLSAVKFIRRFLRHVLPFAYQRVRHLGLYAGRKVWLQAVHLLLGTTVDLTQQTPPRLDLREWLTTLGLADPLGCPFCGKGSLQVVGDFASLRLWLGVLIVGKEVT